MVWCRRWSRVGIVVGLVVGIVALALGALVPRAAAQQDAVDRARYNAEQWLLARLGKPDLTLVEYTYALTTWPNTARGCPAPGETYEAQEVTGYRWTFLFDNMVRYEVHSDVDGNNPVLCWAQSITSDAQLGLFNTTTFAILTPEAWLVFPNENATEVLFAPQQDAPCDQPGMRVSVLGRIASGVTAEQLLTDKLAQLGVEDTPDARESVGASGRSTVYDTACGEGQRRVKLSAFVQHGSAYQVEQWAPPSHFDRWHPIFRNMLTQFTPGTGTLIPGMAAPVDPAPVVVAPDPETAPDGAPDSAVEEGGEAGVPGAPSTPAPVDLAALPPFPLAHLFLGDVFLGALNSVPGRSVTNALDADLRFITFAPNGLALAFIDAASGQLRMLPVENITPRLIAEGAAPDFPPAWSADSRHLAYIGASDDPTQRTIFTVPSQGGRTPEATGTFTYDASCPAPPTDPAETAYTREIGPHGQRNTLEWLPDGRFLVSTGCAGGFALLDPASGQLAPLEGDLTAGVISPDRGRFLARTPDGLVVYNLANGQRGDLSLGADAKALAWAADGSAVFYSTETLAEEHTLDDPNDQARGEAVFGVWPVTFGVYDLSLVRVDLAGPVESTLWRGQGRAIGRIAPAPDGSGVLFSVVPSNLLLAEAFHARGDAFTLESVRPTPALFWLARGSSAAVLLSYSGQPTFAPVTVDAEAG